jgi:hypothetical protein
MRTKRNLAEIARLAVGSFVVLAIAVVSLWRLLD